MLDLLRIPCTEVASGRPAKVHCAFQPNDPGQDISPPGVVGAAMLLLLHGAFSLAPEKVDNRDPSKLLMTVTPFGRNHPLEAGESGNFLLMSIIFTDIMNDYLPYLPFALKTFGNTTEHLVMSFRFMCMGNVPIRFRMGLFSNFQNS